MNSEGPGEKNYCTVEDQQQLTRTEPYFVQKLDCFYQMSLTGQVSLTPWTETDPVSGLLCSVLNTS
jgi:hypothetical protein